MHERHLVRRKELRQLALQRAEATGLNLDDAIALHDVRNESVDLLLELAVAGIARFQRFV